MNKKFDDTLLVPFDKQMKSVLKQIAKNQERSMTAQARYFVLEGIRLTAEQDKLDEIEGNAVAAS